jgi:glyoxylase-like metal-dependent hydrolase (beta-lactamase superfamily II)
VIDAALAPEVYRALADRYGWRIVAVLDTHIHADHLSRARQLAEQVGATLYLPPQRRVAFSFTPLPEGASITIGSAQLSMLSDALTWKPAPKKPANAPIASTAVCNGC